MITYKGQFDVPGDAAEVMQRFTDVPRMSRCMPGASLDEQNEDGSYNGTIVVAFGPKKMRIEGVLICEFDQAARTGTLTGRGGTAVKSAKASVRVSFSVAEAEPSPDRPASAATVDFVSEASFTGVLADFAKAGGQTVMKVLLDEFTANLQAELSSDATDPATPQAGQISVGRLLYRSVAEKFRK